MTTAQQTCMCDCEECLALQAAEDDPVRLGNTIRVVTCFSVAAQVGKAAT
jgi:hypothetical protein